MKRFKIPHTYVIIFTLIALCAIATWFVPAGKYVKDDSGVLTYEQIESSPQSWQIFTSLYEGFTDKADIIVFILIIGGAFWIINSSHAIDIGIGAFIKKTSSWEKNRLLKKIGVNNIILTCIMLIFSIFGAVFGMSEETIAFVVILVPMAISMGYDSITGLCLCFVAAALGFAGAILNPFTIGIAQGLAGLPLFSGIEYRLVCWCVLNIFGIGYILRYAAKVRRDPKSSLVYDDDMHWRSLHNSENSEFSAQKATKSTWCSFATAMFGLILFSIFYQTTDIKIGNSTLENIAIIPILTILFGLSSFFLLRKSVHLYILNLLFFTIFFLVAGVMGYGWYIGEISGLFLAMGILSGWACGYDPNRITSLFIEGCKDIFSAAMVVGLAGGIIVILKQGGIIDTILHSMASGMEGFGKIATVEIMYAIQTTINIFIPSGSAKAALTMPIMATFSDLIGLSKQATVMAFQFGDGFTNLITPTSGVLIAALGMARIPYEKWVRWIFKFVLILTLLGLLLLIPTVTIPLAGF